MSEEAISKEVVYGENILSIDFDFIMFPCIKLYNDACGGGVNSTATWNMLEDQRDISKFLCYDPNAYKNIVKIVKYAIDNGAILFPINEHEQIIDELKKNQDYDHTVYNMVNIDFHHDIMYRKNDRQSILHFDKCNCSNWLGYLLLKDKIDKFTWVKAPNSDMFNDQFCKVEDKITILGTRDFDKLYDIKYHKVFLCLSPQWVPHQYKHLYDLIVELFTENHDKEV